MCLLQRKMDATNLENPGILLKSAKMEAKQEEAAPWRGSTRGRGRGRGRGGNGARGRGNLSSQGISVSSGEGASAWTAMTAHVALNDESGRQLRNNVAARQRLFRPYNE